MRAVVHRLRRRLPHAVRHPCLGAFISGGFAFLVALGASGFPDALIILAAIPVARNLIQTVVGNTLTSDMLSIHPIPNLVSTIAGATGGGLLAYRSGAG